GSTSMLRSRRCVFGSVLFVLAALLGLGLSGAQEAEKKMPPVGKDGVDPVAANQKILKLLNYPVPTNWFDMRLTLKDFIQVLDGALTKQGIDLPILVDFAAFRDQSPDTFKESSDLFGHEISIPQVPKKLALREVLRIAVSQIPAGGVAP